MSTNLNNTNIPTETLPAPYRGILNLRLYEEMVIALYPEQEMRTPVRLYLGQEAVAVGVCDHLNHDDLIFSGRNRKYSRCYGPPVMLQLSGSGLVAPCGMLGKRPLLENHRQDRLHRLRRPQAMWPAVPAA